MKSSANEALVDRFSAAETAVEVGVGHRPEVAGALAATGTRVVATDIEPRPVPADVTFVIDDVTDPDLAVYEAASLVYALRAPPELHRAIRAVARSVDAAACLTTLGGDHPAVPARTETVGGTGLFWVHDPQEQAELGIPYRETERP